LNRASDGRCRQRPGSLLLHPLLYFISYPIYTAACHRTGTAAGRRRCAVIPYLTPSAALRGPLYAHLDKTHSGWHLLSGRVYARYQCYPCRGITDAAGGLVQPPPTRLPPRFLLPPMTHFRPSPSCPPTRWRRTAFYYFSGGLFVPPRSMLPTRSNAGRTSCEHARRSPRICYACADVSLVGHASCSLAIE